MDKASRTAREHIASMADLVGAVRLPEASMRATAGTDVVIDVLVLLPVISTSKQCAAARGILRSNSKL